MRWFGRIAIAALLVGAVTPAFADVSAADEAFKKGRELYKAGKYADACVQFEKSEELDPALGTLFNIAQCDEHIGKVASALAAYREVIAKDTNATRRQTASDNAQALEPRVPKLVVAVPAAELASAKHLVVTLDGKRTIDAGKRVDVDLGEHAVAVHADGMREYTTTAKIVDEGKTVTVTVTLLPEGEGGAKVSKPDKLQDKQPPTDGTPEPTARSRRKTFGIIAMAAGGAAIVTGAVYGGLASSKWSDAKAVCGGTSCTSQADVDRASLLGDQARSKANIATGLFVAGGVIAAVGVVLFVTAPSEHAPAVTMTAHASADGAAVWFSGRF